MKIKFLSLLLALLLCLTFATNLTAFAEEDAPQLPEVAVVPTIVTVKAGQGNDIPFRIKNISADYAYNTTVSLDYSQELKDLFKDQDFLKFSKKFEGPMRQEEVKDVLFNMFIPTSVKQGYYVLKLNLTYQNYWPGSVFKSNGEIQIYVENDTVEPDTATLKLSNINVPENVLPGSKVALSFDISNDSIENATNVRAKLGGLSAENIYISGSYVDTVYDTVASKQTKKVTYNLTVNEDAKKGIYPLTINLTYLDNAAKEQTTTADVYVYVGSSPDAGIAELDIKRAYLQGSSLKVGGEGKIVVDLTNLGDAIATDIRVKLTGFSGSNLYLKENIVDNDSLKRIEKMNAGATFSVSYVVKVPEACKVDSASVTCTVTYKNTDNETKTLTTDIPVIIIQSPENEVSTSVPRIIIDKYDIEEAVLKSGGKYKFSFTLKNTSTISDVANMKVRFSSADGIFLPAEGSNTFYVKSLAKGGTVLLESTLLVRNDAESKTYPLVIDMEYEGNKSQQYTSAENISFSVLQPQILDIKNFMPPEIAALNSPMFITLEYLNKGKAPLNNLTISVKGDFTSAQGELFIGNLAAGNMDYFETQLTPTVSGTANGAIVFTYEDAIGNITEKEIPFTVTVEDAPVFNPKSPDGGSGGKPGMPVPMPNKGGFSKWAYFAIGGGVLLFAGVIVLIIVLVKRKKKREHEDEMD